MKQILIILCILLALSPSAGLKGQGSQPVQAAEGLNPGNRAPDLNLANPDGKMIALSSLRGKMVLIDFWASWCGPCRHENPAVVKAYRRFRDSNFKHGKGFTVYGVSLDVKPDDWKKAIVNDGLTWESHVSDLRGWTSAAALRYDVQSIPANLLINGDGIIVGKNLRGEDLIQALLKQVQ